MVFAGRQPAAPAATLAVPHVHERAWLTPAAAQLIVGEGGTLGPLFNGLTLGGPEPTQADRDRIAAFARANDVLIRFDVVDHELAAVRFSVTYGGCCGYEGADALASRLGRPRVDHYDREYVNDWSIVADDNTYARTHVHVNHLDVRWEHTLSMDEILERAEALVGKDRWSVRAAAGERFVEVDFGAHDRLELPFPYVRSEYGTLPLRGNDLGLQLTTEHGRIAEVALTQRNPDSDELAKAVRDRWGRPHVVSKDPITWSWKSHGHHVEVEPENYVPTITIRAL